MNKFQENKLRKHKMFLIYVTSTNEIESINKLVQKYSTALCSIGIKARQVYDNEYINKYNKIIHETCVISRILKGKFIFIA